MAPVKKPFDMAIDRLNRRRRVNGADDIQINAGGGVVLAVDISAVALVADLLREIHKKDARIESDAVLINGLSENEKYLNEVLAKVRADNTNNRDAMTDMQSRLTSLDQESIGLRRACSTAEENYGRQLKRVNELRKALVAAVAHLRTVATPPTPDVFSQPDGLGLIMPYTPPPSIPLAVAAICEAVEQGKDWAEASFEVLRR